MLPLKNGSVSDLLQAQRPAMKTLDKVADLPTFGYDGAWVVSLNRSGETLLSESSPTIYPFNIAVSIYTT